MICYWLVSRKLDAAFQACCELLEGQIENVLLDVEQLFDGVRCTHFLGDVSDELETLTSALAVGTTHRCSFLNLPKR